MSDGIRDSMGMSPWQRTESTLRVQDAPEAERKQLNRSVDGIAQLSEHCIAVDEGREPPCGCIGEMHNEGCRCSCTDRTPDPLCLIHAAKPLSPDQFEEWFENTFPGLLTLIEKENCSSYGVAKTAWDAALSSTRPEGEAKVTWRVDYEDGARREFSDEPSARAKYEAASSMQMGSELKRIATTVVETRRTKEPSRG